MMGTGQRRHFALDPLGRASRRLSRLRMPSRCWPCGIVSLGPRCSLGGMDPAGSDEEEVRRLLNLLRSLMRLLGFSNREVERRMGLNQGQVSRVLSGQIEAKMALVLGVA